ncbi:hypothetical protein [Pseudomonas sp. TE3610]
MNSVQMRGAFDSGFAEAGFLQFPSTGGSDWASAVTHADGVLYVAYFSGFNYAVTRLFESGETDESFGRKGVVTDTFERGKEPPVNSRCTVSQIILVDDKIVLVGELYSYFSDGRRYTYPAMARYDLKGEIDQTFADQGFKVFEQEVQLRFASTGQLPAAIDSAVTGVGGSCQAGSRLYAILNGSIEFGSEFYAASGILAFDLEGEVATDFGDSGFTLIKHTVFDNNAFSISVIDNEIYLGGRLFTRDFSYVSGFIVKVTPDGALANFGTAGFRVLEHEAWPLGLFAGCQGNLMVVGYGAIDKLSVGLQFSLQLSNGQPDSRFNNGLPLVSQYAGKPLFNRSGISNGDRYWVTARYSKNTEQQAVVACHLADGRRDSAFGDEGLSFAYMERLTDCSAGGATIVLDDKQRLLIAGFLSTNNPIPVVARLLG